MEVVRIVPKLPFKEGSYQETNKAQVLTPDGCAIPGITRITLTAEPNDVWRAQIELLASVESINVVPEFRVVSPWRRVWKWLMGARGSRTPTLDDPREHARE